MKVFVLASDDLRHPTRVEAKLVDKKEYNRMRAAKESLNGLTVVELHTDDRGYCERYIGNAPAPKIKGTMKNIVSSLMALLLLAGIAATAQAQSPIYSVATLYTTNGATAHAGGTAYVTDKVIDCRKQRYVPLQITIYPKTTATDVETFYFVPSVDGVTFGAEGVAFIATPSGTAGTASTLCTNLDAQGFGYYKLSYYTNASAAAGIKTNISVKYGVKISAP